MRHLSLIYSTNCIPLETPRLTFTRSQSSPRSCGGTLRQVTPCARIGVENTGGRNRQIYQSRSISHHLLVYRLAFGQSRCVICSLRPYRCGEYRRRVPRLPPQGDLDISQHGEALQSPPPSKYLFDQSTVLAVGRIVLGCPSCPTFTQG